MATSIDFLQQQYQVWVELADAIRGAQAALLKGEIVAFEQSTQEQQQCCNRLLACRQPDQPAGRPELSGEDPALRREIERVQREIRHLNRVHAALLRRASRSLHILRNMLMRSDASYGPPAAHLAETPVLASKG